MSNPTPYRAAKDLNTHAHKLRLQARRMCDAMKVNRPQAPQDAMDAIEALVANTAVNALPPHRADDDTPESDLLQVVNQVAQAAVDARTYAARGASYGYGRLKFSAMELAVELEDIAHCIELYGLKRPAPRRARRSTTNAVWI